MSRIIASVTVGSALDPARTLRCDALVDTGTAPLVLPRAWMDRLGLPVHRTVQMETADQRIVTGEVAGPVQITIEGFDTIFTEVVFVEMSPEGDRYEPLIGYIVLEQSRAAVDMVGQRLVPVKALDLKCA